MTPFTIWQFKSSDEQQTVVVVRRSEPFEDRFVHHFQRILWRGMASSPQAALDAYAVSI